MIADSFKKIFWGYLALTVIPLLFTPVILGYNVPLQFIGYIIILIGISDLRTKNEYFNKAYKLMYGLIIMSFFSISKSPINGTIEQDLTAVPLVLILGIVSMAIELMFTYNMLMGVGEVTYKYNYIDLYEKAIKFWGYYWKLIVALLVTVIITFMPVIALIALFIVAILTLVLQINIIKLFWDSSNQPWNKEDQLNDDMSLE